MTQEAIRIRLIEIAAEQATKGGRELPAEINDDILKSFGFTSIDALEFLLEIEEAFSISFDDEDLNEDMLSSAEKLAAYVRSRQAEASKGASA
ncbi:MAG: acyl carrier protein [Sediminibacterium sp.]|jgi:acyl carrier protein|nr:acyl carrier protein [Sediminibacterium sp.]